jgi:hypothetical protein
MAHYAFLDENNVVTEVIVGIDETETIDGLSPEEWYGNFRGQVCIRTSYNNNIRFNYAGIGFTYDEGRDAFIAPQPFASWTLDENARWQAPVAAPVNPYTSDQEEYWLEPQYIWDETMLNWIEAPTE